MKRARTSMSVSEGINYFNIIPNWTTVSGRYFDFIRLRNLGL